MPNYTVRKENGEGTEWDVSCSWDELQEMCEEYKLTRVLKPVGFISGTGSNLRSAGEEWQNHLKNMKKNSGLGNNIKV